MRVLTIGTFDLFHVGHARLLSRAASFGYLVAGVNSDRFVSEYKGRMPAEPENRRLQIVSLFRSVNEACINDGPGAELIERVRPGLLVVGSDWLDRDYLAQIGMARERLDELGVAVLFVPRTPGVSTSELRAAA